MLDFKFDCVNVLFAYGLYIVKKFEGVATIYHEVLEDIIDKADFLEYNLIHKRPDTFPSLQAQAKLHNTAILVVKFTENVPVLKLLTSQVKRFVDRVLEVNKCVWSHQTFFVVLIVGCLQFKQVSRSYLLPQSFLRVYLTLVCISGRHKCFLSLKDLLLSSFLIR